MYVNVTTTTVSFSNAYNASSAGTDSQLRNCIGKGGDRVFQFSSAVVDCYNCISDGEYDGTPSVGRGYEGASTATINNCIGVNATSFDFHGSATEDYNASEDTSAAGANSITSQVVADMFNDQTAQDYRPATSGSNQIDDGVDLSGTFTESFEPGVSHNSGASGWEMGSYDDSATPAVPGGANEYLAAHAVRLSSNRRLRM